MTTVKEPSVIGFACVFFVVAFIVFLEIRQQIDKQDLLEEIRVLLHQVEQHFYYCESPYEDTKP